MSTRDAVDHDLLAALVGEPRATIVALSERLGLSRNTVQARLSRLEREGAFLSFDRTIDAASLGYPLQAFVAVHVRQRQLQQVIRSLAEIPEVIQAHGLSGPTDLMVMVVCRDTDDLFRIDGLILGVDGVERAETSLSMGEVIPFRMLPLIDRGRS